MKKKQTFEIKKNIPFDPSYPTIYPFSGMEVGDCFDFPSNSANRVRSMASGFKKLKMKFATRKLDNGMYRCWRIE